MPLIATVTNSCVLCRVVQIEKLQSQLDQEKQTNQDMESLVEELLKEKQKLMKNMETMRGEKDRQVTSRTSSGGYQPH